MIDPPPHQSVDADIQKAVASVCDLRAGYGGLEVLRGISLTLLPAEITVLLGPNGAGKSTLVKCLTGAIKPSAGFVCHHDSRGIKGVALVPQDIALYGALTAAENCKAFALLNGYPRAKIVDRLKAVLSMVGCADVADQRVERLSGGYRRRVNIAVSLMTEPTLMVLDEPTAGLDDDGKAIVATALRNIAKYGASLLIVTHDFEFAEVLSDRVIVLKAGSIVTSGQPRTLVDQAFPSGQEVDLLFALPPTVDQLRILHSLGVEVNDRRGIWRQQSNGVPQSLERLIASLDAAGVAISELKVRHLGLADLYRRLIEGTVA